MRTIMIVFIRVCPSEELEAYMREMVIYSVMEMPSLS